MNDNASSRKSSAYPRLMRQDKDLYLADLRNAVIAVISDSPGKGQEIIQQRNILRDAIMKDLRQLTFVGPSEIWGAFREQSRDVKDPAILSGISELLFSRYAEQATVRIANRQRKNEGMAVTRTDRLEALRRSVVEQLGQSRTNAANGDWGNVLIKGTEGESRKILNGIKKGYFSVPEKGHRLDGESFIQKYPHLFPESRGYNSKKGVADVFREGFDRANALSRAGHEMEMERMLSAGSFLCREAFGNDPEQTAYFSAALGLMWGDERVTEADIKTAVRTVFDAEGERLVSKSNREIKKFEQFTLEKTGKMNRILAVLVGIYKDPSPGNVEKIARSFSSGRQAAPPLRAQETPKSAIESLTEEKRIALKQAFGRALNAGMQTKMVTEERQKLSRFLETGNAFFNLSSGPLVQTLKKSFNVGGGFMVESALDDFFGKPSDENEKVRTIAGNALAAANNALHIG